MNAKERRNRDLVQNIIIVLLSLSAVFLIAQTQLYSLGMDAGNSYLRYLTGDSVQTTGSASATLTSLSAPVRTAVTGVYGGRYGNVTLTTTDDDFEPISNLLRETLGSVRTFSPCGYQEFLAALGGTSVYCDFIESLPLPVLAGLTGASLDAGLSVRRLVISARGEGGAVLYLCDGAGNCQRGDSAVPLEDLSGIVDNYEFNGAFFAVDDPGPTAAGVSPVSLFPLELPALPVFSAAAALPESNTLLPALGFYPRTNSRYTEPGGVEVITDGDRTLRLIPDGAVRYRSGGDPTLTVGAIGETPTLQQSVMGAHTLLASLLPAQNGGLYLQKVRRTETSTTLTFGWQINGVPVRFSDGGSAAEVVLSGNVVSSLYLRFRQYTDTGETSPLLPLRQAMAIAARQEGRELSIGYVDNGTNAAACWLADQTGG